MICSRYDVGTGAAKTDETQSHPVLEELPVQPCLQPAWHLLVLYDMFVE